jgi:hypothetical protein
MVPSIVPNPDVVCSSLQDGGVLLDLTTKQYYALNQTGLLVWQHLEDGGSLAHLHAALAAGERRDDTLGLEAFAGQLLQHGLAEPAAQTNGDTPVPLPSLPAAWSAPTVVPHGKPLSQVILSPFDPTVPIPE